MIMTDSHVEHTSTRFLTLLASITETTFLQGLWLSDVSMIDRHSNSRCFSTTRYLDRFLWADATRGALQVFLRQPGLLVKNDNQFYDERVEDGVWINADPMPGCVVCNIGESKCPFFPNLFGLKLCSVGNMDERFVQEHAPQVILIIGFEWSIQRCL
jgi:hypothetical protein